MGGLGTCKSRLVRPYNRKKRMSSWESENMRKIRRIKDPSIKVIGGKIGVSSDKYTNLLM